MTEEAFQTKEIVEHSLKHSTSQFYDIWTYRGKSCSIFYYVLWSALVRHLHCTLVFIARANLPLSDAFILRKIIENDDQTTVCSYVPFPFLTEREKCWLKITIASRADFTLQQLSNRELKLGWKFPNLTISILSSSYEENIIFVNISTSLTSWLTL